MLDHVDRGRVRQPALVSRTINRRMPAGPMPSLIIADVMVLPNRVNAFMR
jgi:hypothetical protein